MLTPILAAIRDSHPQATAEQVQMIYTMVSLVALPVMLLSGHITAWVSKKALILIGLGTLTAGGLLPAVFGGEMWLLYLSSALVGAGMAAVNIISSALISDHFKGVDKGKIMGLQSAALSLSAAVFSYLSGWIGDGGGWRLSFLIYLLVIPMIVIFARYMPADTPAKQRSPVHMVYNGRIIRMALLGVGWAIFITGFQTNVAMFMEETGYGGATLSGVASALFMLIGLPAGFIMGPYMRLFGRWSTVAALFCAALGMFCVAFAAGAGMVLLGAFLQGAAFSLYSPAAITFAAGMVPAESAAAGIALLNALNSLGKFISPYVLNRLADLAGGSFRSVFLVGGIGMAVLTVIYALLNPVGKEDLN